MRTKLVVPAMFIVALYTGCVQPAAVPPTPPTTTTQAPAPQPTPAPSPSDPSAVEYDSLAAAKAAIIPGYPNVILKPNGKYVIYPNVGPFPGTKVN